ncbi:transposase [Streptomyces sp. NPDC057580]|uniref:IS110 family transposase n=1 Tax=Streptomyces sp. NPDC057580 TaxID=3346173 RepID=UPI0036759FD2
MPSITQSAASCHIPADAAEEVLLGVDTHKDVHAAAVITIFGAALDGQSFPATARGYRQLVAWGRSFGVARRAGVECTGSYGAALARHLHAEGIEVTEVNQPDKAARRHHGKSDAVDAEAAARAVLSARATATAKTSDGPVEMLRLFKLAKGSAIKSRTQAINQLKSVLVCADSALREALASLTNPHLIKRCAALEVLDATGPATAARHTLRLLARRIQHLTEEIDDLNQRIAEAVKASMPGLLDVRGVGPDSAAALLIAAGNDPERLIVRWTRRLAMVSQAVSWVLNSPGPLKVRPGRKLVSR